LTLDHATTGTATSGIGSGILFRSEDTGGSLENAGRISGILANATDGSEQSAITFDTRSDTGSTTLTRRMKLDHLGNLTISGTLTQSGSPDIAENVRVSDATIEGGDVVMIDQSSAISSQPSDREDIYNRFVAKKADTPYAKTILGVISTDPGIVINASKNVVNDDKRSADSERPLVIAGRVPVKIAPDSPPIAVGDYLTASTKPGFAMKATKAGYVVGKALEGWQPGGPNTILVMVQYGYQNYELVLDKNRNLDVQLATTPLPVASPSADLSNIKYQISNAFGETIDNIGVFGDAAIANMKAGLVAAEKISTKALTVEDLLISPIADIDLLRVKSLIAENATVSGTLIAERLVSPTLDQINSQLSLINSQFSTASAIIASIQAKYTSFGAITSATTSGDPLNTSHLYQENATIADLNVTGSIFADSLNSNSDNLFIQPLATGSINLLAGLMSLTPDGNVTINGNLNVTGSVIAKEITTGKSNVDQLTANRINIVDLVISNPATDSGCSLVNCPLSIVNSSSVGFSTIASSSAEIFVPNSKVSQNSLIYVTPIGNTNNQVLFVKSKELCDTPPYEGGAPEGVCLKGFTVAVPSTPSADLKFNYWLIKTQ